MSFFKNLDDCKNKVHVFHCLAGKGRTGTMASMFLIYFRICKNAQVN